jgi:hypothetical protein
MADKPETAAVVAGGKTPGMLMPLLKRVALVVVALLVLVAILFFVPATKPFINRFLGISTPQTSGPCSGNTDLLKRYSTTVKQQGVGALGDISKEVRAKADYKSDSSCVYISMVAHYGANDFKAAYQEHADLAELKNQGKEPSNDIADGINRENLYKTIKMMATDKPENPYAQG